MRPRLPKSMRLAMWAGVREGLTVREAGVRAGVSEAHAMQWFRGDTIAWAEHWLRLAPRRLFSFAEHAWHSPDGSPY